jgi:hypothetical protein
MMLKITLKKKKMAVYSISLSTSYHYYLPDNVDIGIPPIEAEDIVAASPTLPGCKVNFINPVDACPFLFT